VLYGSNAGALRLAQGMVVGWCLGAMVLYGSNSESEQSASQCGSGGKSAGLAVLEKKRWWSDWMFSNFFSWLFFRGIRNFFRKVFVFPGFFPEENLHPGPVS
jgi:hypothetical protein